MHKMMILAPLVMTGVAATRGLAQADEGPRAAIELYFQAHALGNGDYIRQAFAPEAVISFVDGGQLKQWTREEFAKRFSGPAPDEYRRVRRVESLDVNGTAASAVLTLEYPEVTFRDHLLLLKTGGQWKIVSKAFSAERRKSSGQEALNKVLEEWSQPFEPRKIIGNVYYVGSNLISSFLIVTPAGHVLIDTGYREMLPQVEANIEKLGFKPGDVKILLNTQAHVDHCGGFAEFKRQTGATIVFSKRDGEMAAQGGGRDYANVGAFANRDERAYEPVEADRIIADGEKVELGGTSLTANLTPGHTKGCTSWSMAAEENGRQYDVLFLCGLTVSPYKLTNNDAYPNIVEDARHSLQRLRGMHVDVLLAAHGFWFDLEGKAARQIAGAPNPFIDPTELPRHVAEMEKDLNDALQAQERQRLPETKK
jgi:metallo-beta-lactamase class B